MRESYLDYAMSVIISRALPDVRDGLKPVHRRILYTMFKELGVTHAAKFVKSARIVGECLGKYHPHGDAPVYETLVRLAQNFNLRYPLVDGQGNFGSLDGDPAAAPRYTEARMTQLAEELLTDIEKETVDFRDNYDATRKEPIVLPAMFPNLLVNGTLGIAVGMATNIPPHNLSEVIDATAHLIEHPDADLKQLLSFVQGPDFPTGGTVYNQHDVINAYATGRGPIVMRAVTDIEEQKRGFSIVVSEIPYQVNKAELIRKIAALVQTKKIESIRDIRDESDRSGLRIVLELKHDALPRKVLNQLFKYTDLQKTFHYNMVALVDGIQPQTLGLKNLLEHFIHHRQIVIRRRSQYELARAQERVHILQGLSQALDHIDAIIKLIKQSYNRDEAQRNLMKKYKFSDAQARAILELRLQQLAGLERKKIEDELTEKQKLIAYLENLLAHPKKIDLTIKQELLALKQKYGDGRHTRVIKSALQEIGEEELIPEEDNLFVMTLDGYIKRMLPTQLRAQKRGGKGLLGMVTKEQDAVSHFFLANTHDDLLFFTDSGKVFKLKGYEIPQAARNAKGRAIVNFLQITSSDAVTAIVPLSNRDESQSRTPDYLFMITSQGIVKKLKRAQFDNIRKSGMIAISLKKQDALRWVLPVWDKDQIILVTSGGNAIRFAEKDVRPMGRVASGVIGMRLSPQQEVVGADRLGGAEAERYLLVVTQKGYGKRTGLKFYKTQRRGGRGIKTAKVTPKTGALVAAHITSSENTELIAISRKGQTIRTQISSISMLGRTTQGVRIMKVTSGDQIASVAIT